MEELIQSCTLGVLVPTPVLMPLELEHLDGRGRHEKVKASLSYIVGGHPRLHKYNFSSDREKKGTKEQEQDKKKGRIKKRNVKRQSEKTWWFLLS